MPNKLKTFLLFPILAITLTACTLGDLPVIGQYFGGPTSRPVTLNVWGLWEDPQVMTALAEKYRETHPNVTINYEDRSIMNLVDYKERVFARSSEENSQIDIVLVHNSWVNRLSNRLAPAPSSIVDTGLYSSRFYPIASESALIDGSVYAVPAYYDGLVLVYNKAHFSEIGQTFPPTAWEEFRRLALELTIRGGERGDTLVRGGAAIGTADNVAHFSDIIGMMWSQANVTIPDSIDSKPAYDALGFYTNFVLEDGVWSENMPEASRAFTSGQASMIFVPSWQLLDIVQAMPNIEDIGVAAPPQALADSPATWGTFWMYAVPANSQNQQTAWDFINFLSQDAQQLMHFNEASKYRVFGAPYSSVSLSGEITSPLLRPILDTAPFAHSAEIAARSGNNRQETAMKKAVNDVLSGQKTPQEALLEAKATINQ